MNLYNDVPGRMEYIQKLFLDVGLRMETVTDNQEIISILNTEPSEFRSVAYESASFEIGLRDLKRQQSLNQWIEFRNVCAKEHTFHIHIGLGWAFAKAGLFPDTLLHSMQLVAPWMVFDGMGYYYTLFKGRSTLKAKVIPVEISGENLNGFDQGVGRRLWYMAKGSIDDVKAFVAAFPKERHSNLFRGIGIACGYVGGNTEHDLKNLLGISGLYYKQLQAGVTLAAISRIASNSINEDIERACRIICQKTVSEIRTVIVKTPGNFFYLYTTGSVDYLLTQLQSELLQTN